MKTKLTICIVLLCQLFCFELTSANYTPIPPNKPKFIPFSFMLQKSSMTSAGVYNQQGVLIKTLWNGVSMSGGVHDSTWDATDDDGTFVGFGNYQIKVLSSNVTYTWEGIIGNTSTNLTGSTVHQSYSAINGIAISGGFGYYIDGYPEGHPGQFKFALGAPQIKLSLNTPGSFSGNSGLFICSDAFKVFYAGYDSYSPDNREWFVFASNVLDDSQSTFSSGSLYKAAVGSPTYKSVIDHFADVELGITGMAVQQTGNFLFVSHGSLNQIQVYNKTTGKLIQSFSITIPKRLATDAAGNLWVHNGKNTIQKYTVSNTGILNPSGLFISGTSNPLALCVNPDGTQLAVVDGDNSQQIKFYNTTTGASIAVFGQAGGYSNDVIVANDKFYFSDSRDDNKRFKQLTSFTYQPDGSYWVLDTYNRRLMHFSASNVFIEQIMTLPHSRSCAVDPNVNTRLFSDYLEFSIDYSKPLANSWTLVKNWRYQITDDYDGEFQRLTSVTTLKNGRTYALQHSLVTNNFQIIELTASGIRFTDLFCESYSLIMPNGNIRRTSIRQIGFPTTFYEKTLIGFDGSNNPVYDPESAFLTTPTITRADPVLVESGIGYQGLALAATDSGNIITYEGGSASATASSNKFHLGSLKNNAWMWKTAKGTNPDYTGPYPKDGGYDMGNGVQYPGGPVLVAENNIFWGYHGEFWKQSQTNKWQHVYTDGLLVGIFGITGPQVSGQHAPFMMAGNVVSAAIVKIGGDYFLYHCDESYHGGVHRWKISNLNTIKEQIINITLSSQNG